MKDRLASSSKSIMRVAIYGRETEIGQSHIGLSVRAFEETNWFILII